MYHFRKINKRKRIALFSFVILGVVLPAIFNTLTFATPKVAFRFDQMSNSGTGATATHLIGFTYTDTSDPVGSVVFQFCSNSPLIEDPCTAPTGLDLSNVTSIAAQSGEVGFSLLSNSGDTLIIDRNPTVPNPLTATSTYKFDNVINPTSLGEFYLRIQTFSNQLGTGTPIEEGGVALATTPAVFTVNSIVPPYLTFCGGNTISNLDCSSASGSEINFGDFSPSTTSSNSSQFIVATNARSGYNVTIDGDTLTSGNNIIPSSTAPTSSKKGSSQFGINLVANSTPQVGSDPIGPGVGIVTPNYSNTNNYLFNTGDEIADSPVASSYTKYTVSYIVNVSSSQPVGVYATTVTYICLANF